MNENKALMTTILAIVAIAVILVVGIYINAAIELTTDADNTAGTAINDTLTTVDDTGEYLDVYALRNVICGAITAYNASGGELITAANYTQTNCLIVTTGGNYNGSNYNASYGYTFSADTNASVAAAGNVTALNNGNAWLTIIVIAAFAVIVLGMLTSGFRGAGRGETQLTY